MKFVNNSSPFYRVFTSFILAFGLVSCSIGDTPKPEETLSQETSAVDSVSESTQSEQVGSTPQPSRFPVADMTDAARAILAQNVVIREEADKKPFVTTLAELPLPEIQLADSPVEAAERQKKPSPAESLRLASNWAKIRAESAETEKNTAHAVNRLVEKKTTSSSDRAMLGPLTSAAKAAAKSKTLESTGVKYPILMLIIFLAVFSAALLFVFFWLSLDRNPQELR